MMMFCRTCLSQFECFASRKAQFCSRDCTYAAFRAAGWPIQKPAIHKSCGVCSSSFSVNPANAGRSKFCSKKCLGIANGRRQAKLPIEKKMTVCICLQCNAQFYKHISQIKDGRGKFCSRKCLGIYTVHAKRPRISMKEKQFGDALEAAGLTILRNYRIGPWVCDFYVPRTNRVIEFDGDYWHSLPAMKERDQRKDQWLISNGYSITRVSEAAGKHQAVVQAIVMSNSQPFDAIERRTTLASVSVQ